MTELKEYSELFLPQVAKPEGMLVPKDKEQALEDDFESSRETIKNVLERSEEIITRLTTVIRDTDSLRAFEASAALISSITTASKDLLELHERYAKLRSQKEAQQPTNQQNIQNNTQYVFSGTTKDFLNSLKKET